MIISNCEYCGKNFIVPDNPYADEIMYCSVYCKEKDMLVNKKKSYINSRFDILDIK